MYHPYYGSITKCEEMPILFPTQYQPQQPGIESIMIPRPISENPKHIGTGKLQGKVAIITGGDSGIGRAITYLFAKEGADIAIVYLNEHGDAAETKARVEQLGRKCISIAGDAGYEDFCRQAVKQTLSQFGRIDILINNVAEQHLQHSIEYITSEQLERTFRTNFFSYLYFAKAVVPYMKPGSTIINTSSTTAYEGFKELIDYSATKGAVAAFTRALALSLIDRGIRVNAVAPGRTWTPLIPASLPPEMYNNFGGDTPIKRASQPVELAPAYLYLASDDSATVVGQTIHVNGGEHLSLQTMDDGRGILLSIDQQIRICRSKIDEELRINLKIGNGPSFERKPLHVTIWNEFIHERKEPHVAKIYPKGMHVAIAAD